MNVMMITGKYPPQPCGIGDYTRNLAHRLARLNHRVSVLSSAAPAAERAAPDGIDGCEVIRAVSRWDFSALRSILKAIDERSIDVLHVQYQASSFDQHQMMTALPSLIQMRSPRGRKMKIVVTMHEFAGPLRPPLPRFARRLWLLPLLTSAHAVIVSNERDLFYLRRVPFMKNKVARIPLGANIEEQPAQQRDRVLVRENLGLAQGEILLVRFGFIDSIRIRQLDVLLDALKQVCERGHPVKLLLVGAEDPASRKTLAAMAKSLGVGDRLLWTGFCPPQDVSGFLASADIGVFPFGDGASEKRGSLLTAMAFGLPVVSTKGTMASSFVDRQNLLLVPPGDSLSMAGAIEELIDKKDLRDDLSANARRCAEHFSWEKVGQATQDLYRSLAD